MPNTFERSMQMMRKQNPQIQEEGFALLKPVAAGHLAELIESFDSETDQRLRSWLLELIGAAQSADAIPLLTRELSSDDESLRTWAERGLRSLDTKEARTALWRSGS